MLRNSIARRRFTLLGIAIVFVAMVACGGTSRQRRSSVLEYLYPQGKPESPASSVQLELPLNVGVAFVPESNSADIAIGATERAALLERVKAAFAGAEGIGRIEVIPDSFITPGGAFDNVRQIRNALGIDVIALVSYEQTQFDDPNLASITYWTIAGAYVVPGNENETHTLVHATVFDIPSEALLLNASGTSKVEGRATAIGLERSLREDRVTGFDLAVDDMIENLGVALEQFREQVKTGTVRGRGTPAVEVTSASSGGGGVGAGGLGSFGVVLGLLFLALARPVVRHA